MRSMCQVLIKKKRLQCTTKTANLHVRLTQIVFEQVPCHWSSDSESAMAVHEQQPEDIWHQLVRGAGDSGGFTELERSHE